MDISALFVPLFVQMAEALRRALRSDCVGPFHKTMLEHVLEIDGLPATESDVQLPRLPYTSSFGEAFVCAALGAVYTWFKRRKPALQSAVEDFHRLVESCDDLAVTFARGVRFIALKEVALVGFSKPFAPLPKRTKLGSEIAKVASTSTSFVNEQIEFILQQWPLACGFSLPRELDEVDDCEEAEPQISDFLLVCSEFLTRTAFLFHPALNEKFEPFDYSDRLIKPVTAFLVEQRMSLLLCLTEDLSEFFELCSARSDEIEGREFLSELAEKVKGILSQLMSHCRDPLAVTENYEEIMAKCRDGLRGIELELDSYHTASFASAENSSHGAVVQYWKKGDFLRTSLTKGENEQYECLVRDDSGVNRRVFAPLDEEKLDVADVKEVLSELRPLLVTRAEDWAKREVIAAKRSEMT